MPPLLLLFATWSPSPAGLALAVVLSAAYGIGAWRGGVGPGRAVVFYALGIGSLVLVTCGFLQAFGPELRWAYALKSVLLLLVVPLLLGLGKPLAAVRAALGPGARRRLRSLGASRAVRVVTSPLAAPLMTLFALSVFLTPFSALLRRNEVLDGAAVVVLTLLGLAFVIPVLEDEDPSRAGRVMGVQILFVFIELLVDAIPGIALRLNPHVLDHAAAFGPHLAWFPTPLRDQQLAGDILWFLAEAADLPLLVLLLVRFQRSDRREAQSFDDMSAEEYRALTEAHLRRGR